VSNFKNLAVPACNYTYEELAEIYNQTRIDYIVPMPMNTKRMREYVSNYDVNLDYSVVVTSEEGEPIGIGMLGLRNGSGWITRLGVTPNQRERRVGTFLMKSLISNARTCGVDQVQLEVIVGNDPAYNMFLKFGFEPVRELLVIRRPPRPHAAGTQPLVEYLNELVPDEIPHYLAGREEGASWVEETASLLNGGNLKGIHLRMGDGEGWAVFMATRFQLQHIVLQATETHYDEIMFALLYQIHEFYPNRDTKVENVPVDHPAWRAYHAHGYVVDFRRVEMMLSLN